MSAWSSNTSVASSVIWSVICSGLLIIVAIGGGVAFLTTKEPWTILISAAALAVLAGISVYCRLRLSYAFLRKHDPGTDPEPH